MKINSYKYWLSSILLVVIPFILISCDGQDPDPDPISKENEAKKVMTQLWSTSCLNFEIKREDAFNKIHRSFVKLFSKRTLAHQLTTSFRLMISIAKAFINAGGAASSTK